MKKESLSFCLLFVHFLIWRIFQCRVVDTDRGLERPDDYSDYAADDFNTISKSQTLSDRISAKEKNVTLPEVPQNTAPEYMTSLFKFYSKSVLSHPMSNIVRSFKNINQETYNDSPLENIKLRGRTTRVHLMIFNITSIPADEIIDFAELRLYTIVERYKNIYIGVDRKVSVYDVNPAEDPKYHLIDSKHIYGRSGNWETLNVTSALRRWVRSDCSIHMLEIRVESVFHSLDLGDMFIDTKSTTNHEPLLVVFSNIISQERLHTKERHELVAHEMDSFDFLESSLFNNNNEIIENNYNSDNSSTRIKRRVGRKSAKNVVCRRRPLYIHFKDIDWDRWIIAPQGYQAYQCVGKCYFPLHDYLSPTKHSIIQTLVHSKYPRRASRACCVPTKLEPISILYMDEQGVVTFKYKYDGMVVSECGCR